MSSLEALNQYGQSVWLDFIARGFTTDGSLRKLIEADGVRGVTSNPAIFERAIGHSGEYDAAITDRLEKGDCTVADLFEHLAVEDIQKTADVLRPIYDGLNGEDGYVSLEVSPYLAANIQGSIDEARRLWNRVDRANLMVKIPATPEGIVAIKHLIADGTNINVTLLFSQAAYRDVVEAYMSGLEALIAAGGDPSHVASVASFFISRIDASVDHLLDKAVSATSSPAEKDRLARLKGKTAIANAKMAYQDYRQLFSGPRWEKLKAHGAKPQRLLWASTGTKNPDYSDVLYVEELIGQATVNTLPPATLDAFRDHGKPRASLEDNIESARQTLSELRDSGISLQAVTENLLGDGIQQFVDAADKLYSAVTMKRAAALGSAINRQKLSLSGRVEQAVEAALAEWRANGKVRRLWQKDKTIWRNDDEDRWLGWMTSIVTADISRYEDFSERVREQNFNDAVVLGMGGSSLGPEVLAETFPRKPGFPKLRVLDSTDPAQVRGMEKAIDPARTLFVVSSKSGGTTEPNVMKDYFFARVCRIVGPDKARQHFVAVTDPESSLDRAAGANGYAQVFHGDPAIGGRYSIFSPFGFVPAAVAGIDIRTFVAHAITMVNCCGPDVPPDQNPGVQLGLALGAAALSGRNKVTFFLSKQINAFGAWAEQLIAESTGKDGKGLIPIDGEPLAAPSIYGDDRFFIDIRIDGDRDDDHEARLTALENAGHPVVRITMESAAHLGQEFFRFEIATTVAGSVLGINPFNQPDVESAKVKTRDLTAAFEQTGALPAEFPVLTTAEADIHVDENNAKALRDLGADAEVASWIRAHLSRLERGDYFALLAYIARDSGSIDALQRMRIAVRDSRHVATCAEFGPRFLHSTGQAYKGGPACGVFLQITVDDADDLPVPGQKVSFGIVKAAQARGDFDALAERGRRVLRIHLRNRDIVSGLAALESAILSALI